MVYKFSAQSEKRLSTIKNPDDDVIIIHNVGERRAIYCAPLRWQTEAKCIVNILYGSAVVMVHGIVQRHLTTILHYNIMIYQLP